MKRNCVDTLGKGNAWRRKSEDKAFVVGTHPANSGNMGNTSCLELHCAVELPVTVDISELFSMALIATNHL